MDDVDGIQATSVIRDVHLIPGIWQIDGYTKLVDHIEQKFDVTLNENLFEFPYDWRRDNRVASRQLATQAQEWLKAWRAKSGNPDAKLIIIGHSMGGLVARHFLECRDGWRDTRQLITIATPYGGALGSLGTLVNGKKIKFFDLTDVARSMTALYQLLPVYPCYDDGGGHARPRSTEAAIPNLDAAKAKAALDFHMEIRAAVEQHLKDAEYVDNRYDIRPIVGIEQPTRPVGDPRRQQGQAAPAPRHRRPRGRRHGAASLGHARGVREARERDLRSRATRLAPERRRRALPAQRDPHAADVQPRRLPQRRREGRAVARRDRLGHPGRGRSRCATRPLGDPGGLLVANVQNVDTGEELPRVPFRKARGRLVRGRARAAAGRRLPGHVARAGASSR